MKVATAPGNRLSCHGCVPGPVTVKVVAGDVRVAQFIASLKVALSTWAMGTPVAPFTGIVEITIVGRRGDRVVKLHT